MSRTVTALYDTPEDARAALQMLKAQVPLAFADTYDRSPDRIEALNRVDLSREELTACRVKLATGGYLLLAQVEDGEDPQAIVTALERISEGGAAPPSPAPAQGQDAAAQAATVETEPAPPAARQEQPAAAEEEVRVGTQEVVRGRSSVDFTEEEPPRLGEVELMEELVRVENRPSTRLVSEEEIEQAGLLRDRTIEIVEKREEPVVEKQAFVREEVVIKKAVEQRVEQVHETVRHTEVDVEKTRADRGATTEADERETLEGSHGRS